MKNYKHVSNSNNAMKLAAVASAAIMLAPMAMNSVSSFATGGLYENDSLGDQHAVLYPEYTKFATVDSAVAAQNGTNGQNNSGSQEGATVGFNLSDLQNVLNQINALTINPNAGAYQSQFDTLHGQFGKLSDLAKQAQDSLTTYTNDKSSSFYQMSAENQRLAKDGLDQANSKFTDVFNAAGTAGGHYFDADQAAQKASPADAARLTAVANAAAQDYKTAIGKFQSYIDLVASYNQILGRKTNNGSVYEAAQAAGLAISHVPAGADRDALTASLSQIQAVYALATQENVNNNNPAAAKRIDAAAAKAVADLNDLAGKAFTLAPTSANGALGTVKVNYNKNYGIQIWTASGKAVRFNKDEVAKGYTLFGKPVKVGDAKKLQGQKNFKVFAVNGKNTVQMNGTTYYNLGGDQYIDAAFVTLNAAK